MQSSRLLDIVFSKPLFVTTVIEVEHLYRLGHNYYLATMV